mmetsp:Transcript_35190/g.33428  ORF Transcript_35190/g.33428 Transcript_35190/m.33428 type:complete len:129 (+) Transcript_35190:253-639(+)
MLLLFLPRPAIIFEIFPYKYYKRGYGPFGGEYGVIHGGVMSPPLSWHNRVILSLIPTSYCMLSKMCREYARNDNVRLTDHGINRLLALINDNILKFTSNKNDKNDNKITNISQKPNISENLLERDFLY